MRVPLSWLQDYVNIDLSAEEVADLLTNAGLEVKEIEYIGLPGAALEWDREKLVLARLLKVEQHPDADRLVLATVDYGAGEPKVVVTGAPNLFEYIGRDDLSDLQLYSPYALEGAVLYDGHKPGRQTATLKGRALRGIYNDSMLCSEKELGISDEHEGIVLMQQDEYSPAYKAGTSLTDVLGDAVLEIDIIPNIARCASMVGVARELAALTNQPIQYPDYSVVMDGPPVDDQVLITTDEPELNPRFTALIIDGVQQIPSPYWMQRRLRLAGQRPINVVVDISNYVMLEMGQPNHTFDYNFLRQRADEYAPDGPVHINTRLAQPGETLTTLDGIVHELPPTAILVTDPAGNLSLGGVMGGLDSEIKDDTTSVLLEAAAWNFINIRRTASTLGIHTEAGFRFSRGVHPSQTILGANRAAELLRQLAGGTVRQGIIDTYPLPPEPVVVELNPAYARQLSGLNLSAEDMAELLERLEFAVDPYGDYLQVITPDHRLDIEGPHDLVEEICRMYRYDRIPSTLLSDSLPPQHRNTKLEREERLRDMLVALGLQEAISYRLTSPARENRLLVTGAADDRPYVTLTNPPAPDRTVMRHTILSSVLEAAAANSRHTNRIALFEIGNIYLASEESELPDELSHLAIVLTGQQAAEGWQGDQSRTYDYYDLKGMVEQLFSGLHIPLTVEAVSHPTYRPGRAARLVVDGQQVGVMGELHPAVVKGFELRIERDQPVLGAQLNLELLQSLMPDTFPYRSLSTYPPVLEDLALVVDRALPAADVEAALREAGGFLLSDIALFDVYEGDQLPSGKKSLAYHLTFQAPDKTLTDKDVYKQRQRILKKLDQSIGAKLRE
ncbi:MAG: phenylalanine--tRNA ligase subunit beta [Chloroflexota bacterium]